MKQLVDEASWFQLACQRQHSAVICSAFAIQQQSTAPQSGHAQLPQVCAVECHHAPHLWHLPLYTFPMASSAVQHWTASPMKESCHWQAHGENCQTQQLANPAWYPVPTIATIDIQEPAVARLATNWHQKPMEAWMKKEVILNACC